MSVTMRPYKRGGWEYGIILTFPTGEELRERRKAPPKSLTAATRWAEARERHLILSGPPSEKKEVLTLEQFAPRFLDEHARANQMKPSGIAHKETILIATPEVTSSLSGQTTRR